MARSSSSTKKAAKLAQKGKGQKVRFQGGTVFPMAVAAVIILGVALIAYSRQSVPAADASPPTIDDHWHAAYGFNICGEWYEFMGNLEERNSQGQFINTNFLRTGIHSHDDGVIHWHPYTSEAVGNRAVLGVFLETYGVELSNDELKLPEGLLKAHGSDVTAPADVANEWKEGEDQCDGEDVEIAVKAWDSYTDTDGGTRYIANMGNVRVAEDGMVFAIYVLPDGADQTMPPWASELPQLGLADTNQAYPDDLLESDTSSATDEATGDASTEASTGDASTGDASTGDGSATDSTVPATTAATSDTSGG